jgi:hypothetical protein
VKFRSLHKWHLTEPLNGLVFFAQRLDELLFDYTLDSYKPSALNASSLSIEALAVISGIEKGEIEAANLDPVLDELEYAAKMKETRAITGFRDVCTPRRTARKVESRPGRRC